MPRPRREALRPEAPGPEPASIADDSERPLDPRYVPLQRAVGWITTAAVTAGVFVGAASLMLTSDLPGWAKGLLLAGGAAAILVFAWLGHYWPVREYRHTAYRVSARGIEIRRGVLWRKVINVPRSRVQHTDVSQGPIERRFGLATLVIYTAGTEHAEVRLPGLDHATAMTIRDHLLVGGGDDAV